MFKSFKAVFYNMSKVAIVDKYGAFLAVKDGRFQLRYKDEVLWDLAPVELEAIVFTVTGVSVSVAAIKLANEFFIDLVFMDGNEPIARLIQARYGPPIKTWIKQVKAYKSGRVRLAQLFVEGKKEANSVNEVREVEAIAARYYWGQVAKLVPSNLGFTNRIPRSRKPVIGSIDPFNEDSSTLITIPIEMFLIKPQIRKRHAEILQILAQTQEPLTIKTLAEKLKIDDSTTRRHILKLRKMRLVEVKKGKPLLIQLSPLARLLM